MRVSDSLSVSDLTIFAALIACQVLAISLLPKTDAFADVNWTALCIGVNIVSIWMMSFIVKSGISLSIMIPIMAALVPLAIILVDLLIYKQVASVLKIFMLCGACMIIGVASALK